MQIVKLSNMKSKTYKFCFMKLYMQQGQEEMVEFKYESP